MKKLFRKTVTSMWSI